jgi:RNA polymerase sigma-70 factor (ECF subfamily)
LLAARAFAMMGRVLQGDAELMEAWRRGDEAAGEALLRRHRDAVDRFFRVRVPDAADDLVQATMLACVEGRDRVRGHDGFRAYLFGIARRKLLMYLRDRSRHDRAMRFREAQGPDTALTPSGVVTMCEEQRLLLVALQRLPVDLQIAVQLFYWEGLKNREIADVLEIPMSTVGNRIARARELVRDALFALPVPSGPRGRVVEEFERWARSLVPAREAEALG